ncbi:MAG: helix-hairpin-helix domain-containing protein, partial [Desulfobacteraceae bacterium]|nr:helix-hairpin-helix domain-containing protein [Desulfobacteraceae bacterium]
MRKIYNLWAIMIALCLLVVFAAPVLSESKVNINTASQEELCTLKNIGEAYAKRIIEYRNWHKFEKPEALMKVKGIGSKTYEFN